MSRKTYYDYLMNGLCDLSDYLNGDHSKGRRSTVHVDESVRAESVKLHIDESINEADYAGYDDPFDYQIWNQLSVPREDKDLFIDGIHELGLEWKLGHLDKKTNKVELKVFGDQSEMEQLFDYVDSYKRG